MKDFYEYSTPELVHMLGERFKEYRMRYLLLFCSCEIAVSETAVSLP